MGFNWLSTRRSWSRPDLRPPTAGQTPSFHSPQIWWGLPRCVPIQDSPFHLVLTRKCVGDRQVIEIWCHFSHCASHLLRPDFIPTASSPSQPSQVPSYTRLIPQSHYHFYVRMSAALPRITLIRVALSLDGSGRHPTHNESSNIGLPGPRSVRVCSARFM